MGSRDFQWPWFDSSSHGFDLGMSKSKVKFSKAFNLDPLMLKILILLPLNRI